MGYSFKYSTSMIDFICDNTSIYNKSQLTEALNNAQMYCEYRIKSNEWYEQVNRILSEYI